MEWYWIVIILFLILCLITFLFFFYRGKKGDNVGKPKNIIVSDFSFLSFSYSVGYTVNANYSYEIQCDDCPLAKIKPNGVPEDTAITVELSSDTMKEIQDLLHECQVDQWNGFHETAQNVLDGDSFSFSLRMKNGDSISASGYMRFPENYGKVKQGFLQIFEKYL